MLLDDKVEKFLTVAQHTSMSQAAKELYISQPALTTQIRKLEEEVGFNLLIRTPRGTQLTEAGQAFKDAMERVQNICSNAVSEGRAIENAHHRKIVIGILDAGEINLIKPALDAMHADHPEIDIEIKTLPHPFNLRKQALFDNLADCFIYGMRQENLGDDLAMLGFFTSGESLAMPPDYDLADQSSIKPGDLSGRTVYFPKENQSVSPTKTLREWLVEENPGINLLEQQIDPAFLRNLPYLTYPLISLEKIMQDVPNLVVAPLESNIPPATFGLVYRREHPPFLDPLLARLAEQWGTDGPIKG